MSGVCVEAYSTGFGPCKLPRRPSPKSILLWGACGYTKGVASKSRVTPFPKFSTSVNASSVELAWSFDHLIKVHWGNILSNAPGTSGDYHGDTVTLRSSLHRATSLPMACSQKRSPMAVTWFHPGYPISLPSPWRIVNVGDVGSTQTVVGKFLVPRSSWY